MSTSLLSQIRFWIHENLRSLGVASSITALAAILLLAADDLIRDWVLKGFALRVSRGAVIAGVTLILAALVIEALAARSARTHGALARLLRRVMRALAPLAGISTLIWLTAIVVLSASLRIALSPVNTVPTVFGDELIYSGLAKGYVTHGQPLLRGQLELGYSLFYPLLASPAWAFASGVEAFEIVKMMNAVAMAVTAVPAYLLARRAVSRNWAIGVAALTAFAPWTAYSAFVMTESLFYPTFTVLALLFVRMLERPSLGRQSAVLAGLVGATLVRPQAAVLAASVAAGVVVSGALVGSVREALRRHWLVLAGLGGMSLAYAVVSESGVQLPGDAYLGLIEGRLSVVAAGEWAVRNIAAYELGVGVIALIAFPLAVYGLLERGASIGEQALGVTAVTFAVGILASVAVLSASPYGLDRLHERSLFYVTPLVVACLARWLSTGSPRPARLTFVAVTTALLVPASLSTDLLQSTPAIDSLVTSPFRDAAGEIPVDARAWALAVSAAGIGAFLLTRRALLPILCVAVAFGLLTAENVYPGEYVSPLTSGQAHSLESIDLALPDDASATIVYVGPCFRRDRSCIVQPWDGQELLVSWIEFFNTRIESVASVFGPSAPGGLSSPRLTLRADGVLLESGRPLTSTHVVVDSRWPIVGTPLHRIRLPVVPSHSRLRASLTLWRVEPPLRFARASRVRIAQER